MNQKKVGLTLGKFAPLHRGHQYMIETALQEVDELNIIIYDADEIEVPLSVRARWIRTLYPEAIVYEAWDGPKSYGSTPEIEKENEDYVIELLKGKEITHFYSSEFYGDHMSRRLNAVNRLVDPSRSTIPISGTKVRENPYTSRSYLHPLVYQDLVTKVVFLGAPSTGKTTLTEALAQKYNTIVMPEYGREYWHTHQINRRLEPEQLVEIARVHLEREDQLVPEANRYLIVDTNAITTYMFAKYYHGFVLPELEQMALLASSRYDLVFLCKNDIPYDNTWDRSGDVQRQIFQKQIQADLAERRIPYFEIGGTLEERMKQVDQILAKFTKYDNLVSLLG